MLPILFSLGPLKIYTFGIFLVLAFFWSSFLLWKNIRLTSYKEEEVFDGFFLSLAGGLFFGRLVYVLLNFKDFGFNLLKFILINGYPGISLYGLTFGLLVTLWLFFNSKKINFLEAIDYFISPFFVALVLCEFGAFFSGVEVGSKTKFLLRIRYLGYDGFRHLTGLYEALIYLLAVYFSYRILFEIRKERFKQGFLLVFFLWFFSFTSFLFDRIKVNHLYLTGYSFNKVVSAVLLLTTSFYFVYYFKSEILNYGQKIIKKIHFPTKGKTSQGERKKS